MAIGELIVKQAQALDSLDWGKGENLFFGRC